MTMSRSSEGNCNDTENSAPPDSVRPPALLPVWGNDAFRKGSQLNPLRYRKGIVETFITDRARCPN